MTRSPRAGRRELASEVPPEFACILPTLQVTIYSLVLSVMKKVTGKGLRASALEWNP